MAALTTTQSLAVFFGRLCYGTLFLSSVWHLLSDWSGSVAEVARHGMPAPEVFLLGAVALMLTGGVMVGLGIKARVGAVLLIAFLVPVTFVVHDYWNHMGDGAEMHRGYFYLNLALTGGLSWVWVYGAGPFSVDGNKQKG